MKIFLIIIVILIILNIIMSITTDAFINNYNKLYVDIFNLKWDTNINNTVQIVIVLLLIVLITYKLNKKS